MDLPFDTLQTACSLLGIDSTHKTAAELELIFWKTMYGQLVTQVEQLHAAYERVLLGECNTVKELSQYEADVAFLTAHFISSKPFDVLEFLRTNPEIVRA